MRSSTSSDDQWRRAVARLREVRLLAPVDPSDPGSARRPSSGARMVRRTAAGDERSGMEGRAQPTLRASARHDPAKARRRRSPISRRSTTPSPTAAAPGAIRRRWTRFTGTEFVAGNRTAESNSIRAVKLGAVGSDLAAISWFFDRPYETPVATLTPPDRSWVLSEASFGLRAQGRLQEALPAMRAGLRMTGRGAGLEKCGDQPLQI